VRQIQPNVVEISQNGRNSENIATLEDAINREIANPRENGIYPLYRCLTVVNVNQRICFLVQLFRVKTNSTTFGCLDRTQKQTQTLGV
jgi:aromatic ring-opening dioxygenase catalytic subunit (LigB family)